MIRAALSVALAVPQQLGYGAVTRVRARRTHFDVLGAYEPLLVFADDSEEVHFGSGRPVARELNLAGLQAHTGRTSGVGAHLEVGSSVPIRKLEEGSVVRGGALLCTRRDARDAFGRVRVEPRDVGLVLVQRHVKATPGVTEVHAIAGRLVGAGGLGYVVERQVLMGTCLLAHRRAHRHARAFAPLDRRVTSHRCRSANEEARRRTASACALIRSKLSRYNAPSLDDSHDAMCPRQSLVLVSVEDGALQGRGGSGRSVYADQRRRLNSTLHNATLCLWKAPAAAIGVNLFQNEAVTALCASHGVRLLSRNRLFASASVWCRRQHIFGLHSQRAALGRGGRRHVALYVTVPNREESKQRATESRKGSSNLSPALLAVLLCQRRSHLKPIGRDHSVSW